MGCITKLCQFQRITGRDREGSGYGYSSIFQEGLRKTTKISVEPMLWPMPLT
jgi:hypothetical protein